jgi:hypothetical protein
MSSSRASGPLVAAVPEALVAAVQPAVDPGAVWLIGDRGAVSQRGQPCLSVLITCRTSASGLDSQNHAVLGDRSGLLGGMAMLETGRQRSGSVDWRGRSGGHRPVLAADHPFRHVIYAASRNRLLLADEREAAVRSEKSKTSARTDRCFALPAADPAAAAGRRDGRSLAEAGQCHPLRSGRVPDGLGFQVRVHAVQARGAGPVAV